ncbi:MAG: TIGR03862 family flavoprotein [Lentimicrobium sp.]|nr:TIGR03862 family flavoprotein [Lentimicrobium sp.]
MFQSIKQKPKVTVVGGGPAGMRAAWVLADDFEVHLFEKEKMLGQKFLVAGKGGLNLTKNLSFGIMRNFYSPSGFIDEALQNFDSGSLREWMNSMQIETFAGSSGKVFPVKGITPADVLKKIILGLSQKGVVIHLKHKLVSFSNDLVFSFICPDGITTIKSDFGLFAFGGASWPETGSNGEWIKIFNSAGLLTTPFRPSNCGINIAWPESFIKYHEGKPLKNIEITVGGSKARGEALITKSGMEGSAVYQLVPTIRNLIEEGKKPVIQLDLKPFNSPESLALKVNNIKTDTKDYTVALNLNAVQMALLKIFTDKETFSDPLQFIRAVKALRLKVQSLRPIEEAISTVGGLDLNEINSDFSLKKYPRIFVSGEMLDWDAPTGGFLLQGSFASSNHAAMGIIKKAHFK